MSSPSSDVIPFGTVDILELGRTYRALSEELACKALAEANPGPHRETEQGLGGILADEIVSALNNIHPKYSDEEIIDIIHLTFAVACLKKSLEKETDCGSGTLRKAFYERMCSPDPGVSQVTHPNETNQYDREAHPIVEKTTDFLLDEDSGGSIIPGPVIARADEDWRILKGKAKDWGTEYGVSDTEACREVIAATIAVEVHTGGDPDHVRPYQRYIFKEAANTLSELRQLGREATQSMGIDDDLYMNLVDWAENEYNKS